jgi:hypothetical protein
VSSAWGGIIFAFAAVSISMGLSSIASAIRGLTLAVDQLRRAQTDFDNGLPGIVRQLRDRR